MPLTSPVDVEELRRMLADDDELIGEVIALFLADYPVRLETLAACLAAEDYVGVASVAHALKGSASNISASCAAEAARALERSCSSGDRAGVTACAEHLVVEFARLATALGELRRSHRAGHPS